MGSIRSILRTEIPLWPFEWANLCVVPLAIMFAGCYRTWSTAASPFEEFAGVMLAISLALLWAIFFGSVLPSRREREAARLAR